MHVNIFILYKATYIIIENGGEKFQFLSEIILVTDSCGSVYQGNEERLFVYRTVM
jgi:hypothetical protein